MACKKSLSFHNPPDASSEEEVDSSEKGEEQEEEQVIGSKPLSNKESNSEADEEESQGSDEQQSEEKNQENTKSSKKIFTPESDVEKSSDSIIKPSTGTGNRKPKTPVSKPAVKRGAENEKSPSKAKKAKTLTETPKTLTETPTAVEEDEEDGGGMTGTVERKSAVNRLWSEEDEIHMLKGLLEFEAKFEKDVSTHYQEFHDFVKDSLSVVDVSKNQLSDKVRRLKRKFKTNFERSNNGADPPFSKPHELKVYRLCKKIWGNNEGGNGNDHKNTRKKENKKKASRQKFKAVENDLVKGGRMPNLPIPDFVKSNLSLIGSSKLKDLDAKWKKQNAAEMEVYLRRIDLLHEEARLVIGAMKNNEH